MANEPYEPWRAALEADAHTAVGELYKDYLVNRVNEHGITSAEMQNRLDRYEKGNPAQSDRQALRAAEEVHVEVAARGGSDREAADAAHEKLQDGLAQGRQGPDGPASGNLANELSASAQLNEYIEQTENNRPAEERSSREMSASEKLNEYIEKTENNRQGGDRSPREELEQHLQAAKHEITLDKRPSDLER